MDMRLFETVSRGGEFIAGYKVSLGSGAVCLQVFKSCYRVCTDILAASSV